LKGWKMFLVKSHVDFGFRHPKGTRDCGIRIRCFQSAIRNPQSAIVSRQGLSLTEVLISLGLLTLGLLGVLSLFPVGSVYLAQAETADRGASLAKSVMSDLVTRGMLDPNNWAAAEGTDGFRTDISQADLIELQVALMNSNPPTSVPFRQGNCLSGSVYVIDPLGVASFRAQNEFRNTSDPNYTDPRWLANFPGHLDYALPTGLPPTSPWYPWGWANGKLAGPLRRVTFPGLMLLDLRGRQASMSAVRLRPEDHEARMAAARLLASTSDELTFDLPAQDDRPAIQNWQVSLNSTALSRQSVGDYSWLATVAPTSTEARNAMGSYSPFAYDVSVVVSYKRAFFVQPNPTYPGGNYHFSPDEFVATAKLKSTGPSGGELLVETKYFSTAAVGGTPAADPLSRLRTGGWVCVYGPSPNSTSQRPLIFFAWYQVQAVDRDIVSADKATHQQRYVTLRGPEWPWQPSSVAGDTANNLCVGVFPSAVAVHTKSLRH
jgi:Tfp pilus assembly protein PilV